MTLVFLASISSLIIASLLHTRTAYNLFTVLATPYVLIVLINEYVASPRFGFYHISDDTLIMLMEGLGAFFIGSIPFSKENQRANQERFDVKTVRYNMRAMSLFILICGIICFVQAAVYLAGNAQLAEGFDDVTASLNEGWAAHLKLIALSVAPITLYYGLSQHDSIAIVGTALVFISVFLSFIKYNIICPIAASAIYAGLTDKGAVKKSTIAIFTLPIGLFLLNYYLGFYARGATANVDNSFYLNHLWAYVGGSLIYDNYIFSRGIRIGIGAVEKLMTFVFAFPNMFIHKIFGIRLFPHVRQPDLFISIGLEQSNVVDAIGYLYPSHGGVLDIVEFLFVMMFIGLLFSVLARVMLKHSEDGLSTTFAFFLSEFVLMSFYGTFYINSGPWEQLIWCAIIPQLFMHNNQRDASITMIQGRRTSNVFE